ncbi:MAG: molybdopterin molybdenumtransferase MoeA [Promethearchaeota archaeon]|nr:MAG: molybdopterin molybdenumtransferase MoeA [Candidatus Lokiarchaeota archaeon]
MPHFKKSRMDGFAVRAEDTFGAEENNLISLKLKEIIEAGDIPQRIVSEGQCSYVATGAAIPEGADAVVMIEYSDKRDNDEILISKAVSPGTYVIEIGHDIKKDEVICKKGKKIDLPTLGVLASCGIGELQVLKKPKVALISTGNELVSHEISDLPIGKIYDVNSIVLENAISNTGVEVNYLGIVKDDFGELSAKVEKALHESDIVILSGGTSKGEGDLGPRILDQYDSIELMVHGVKIKPGKPIVYAKFNQNLNHKMIFILPGYPTSSLSCFFVFVDEFLRKLTGKKLRKQFAKELEVGERIYSSIGRYHFKPVILKEINGVEQIFPIQTGSEAISTLFYSDGYIIIEELEEIVEKGDKKRFYTY